MVAVLLGFAEKNPGMTRVLIGDALVNEDERLQARMNQLYDRIEAALRQSLKIAQAGGAWPGDPVADANVLLAFVVGRWTLFAKSGFKRLPQDGWDAQRKYPVRVRLQGRKQQTLRRAHRRRGDPAARDRADSPLLPVFPSCTSATRTVLSASIRRSGCTTMPSMTAPSRNST